MSYMNTTRCTWYDGSKVTTSGKKKIKMRCNYYCKLNNLSSNGINRKDVVFI